MSMSKKHYVKIADFLASDSKLFDRARFLTACGVK